MPTPPPVPPAAAEPDEPDDFEVVGEWEIGESGIEYEAQVFADGCRLVVVDMNEDEELAIALADGLSELDHTIRILQEARAKFAALPAAQQGAPDPGDPDEEDEDEGDEEEDEEIEEGPPSA